MTEEISLVSPGAEIEATLEVTATPSDDVLQGTLSGASGRRYISLDLRKDLTVILTLATFGVLLSAATTTLGMRYVAHWEWTSSVIFGLLIAVEGFWNMRPLSRNSFIFLLIGIRVFEQQFTPVLYPQLSQSCWSTSLEHLQSIPARCSFYEP